MEAGCAGVPGCAFAVAIAKHDMAVIMKLFLFIMFLI
jgi:sulfite reductase beta subunit-like hemoprotein